MTLTWSDTAAADLPRPTSSRSTISPTLCTINPSPRRGRHDPNRCHGSYSFIQAAAIGSGSRRPGVQVADHGPSAVQQVSELERHRLARELHGGAIQEVLAAGLAIDLCLMHKLARAAAPRPCTRPASSG